MPLDMDKIPGPAKRPELPDQADLPPDFENVLVFEELRIGGNWFNLGVDKLTRFRRAKVPGGWFVVMGGADGRSAWFYPDPDHSWPGTSMK